MDTAKTWGDIGKYRTFMMIRNRSVSLRTIQIHFPNRDDAVIVETPNNLTVDKRFFSWHYDFSVYVTCCLMLFGNSGHLWHISQRFSQHFARHGCFPTFLVLRAFDIFRRARSLQARGCSLRKSLNHFTRNQIYNRQKSLEIAGVAWFLIFSWFF